MISDTQAVKQSISIRRRLTNLMVAGFDVYGILVLVFILMRVLFGERLRLVGLGNNFLHWALLPIFMFAITLLQMRRWKHLPISVMGIIVFVVLYGGLFAPRFALTRTCTAGSSDCSPLRVMTFNLYGLPQTNYTQQMSVIREANADVVAMQELSEEAAAAIDASLADLYPHRYYYPYGIPGTGIVSKYPIIEQQEISSIGLNLVHMRAMIDVNGAQIVVFSVHPPPPGVDRNGGFFSRGRGEITALSRMGAAEGRPVLMLGDFNTVDQSEDYQLMIDAGFIDSFREAGWGFGSTWPSRIRSIEHSPPLIRIDYIWHSAEFRTVRAWVGRETVSDHRPVIADLVYTP
jgi:vancomycin resistance protein VanJ